MKTVTSTWRICKNEIRLQSNLRGPPAWDEVPSIFTFCEKLKIRYHIFFVNLRLFWRKKIWIFYNELKNQYPLASNSNKI